jgi:glycolate dehydrogenase FAD-binding subunit
MTTTAGPRLLQPCDAVELAAMLRSASDERLAVLVQGRGTKAGWGQPAARVDTILSVARLHGPIEHCAGDLTVTVPAGTTLDALNARLGEHQQWLPLDPLAGSQSSIGGLLATNDSGPRRLRYGAPRDLVIGIEFALVDGRRAKSGGKVVKNVAGYDLGRLLCGSYGTLAVITAATFKLAPRSTASRTVVAEVPSRSLDAFLRTLSTAPGTPTAIELDASGSNRAAVHDPARRVLVRFETTPAAADAQAAQVASLAVERAGSAGIFHGAAESETWEAYESALRSAPGTLVKLAVLPTDVTPLLKEVERLTTDLDLTWHLGGRATLGTLVLRANGDTAAVVRLTHGLRAFTSARSGHVAVVTGPPDVMQSVAVWDDVGPAALVMRSVKAQFDPTGTLCPGGGPGGLGGPV